MRTANDRPTQGVIFAGGRGTRLGHLTRDLPKPMVEVAGRPFVEYLIELLRDQGVDRIVMLLGYRSDALVEHLGDGRRWGVSITFSVTDADVQTLTRWRAAEPLLDDTVLMAYCDNYVPLDIGALWREFRDGDAAVQVTAYANEDGFTRSNLDVDDDGLVRRYDPARSTSGLNRVDLGFAIVDRARLGPVPLEDRSFEHALYPGLVRRSALRAHVTQHRYYGVGSTARLPAAERFFGRPPAVILDRDGVLNRRAAPAEYVTTPDELVWLDGAREALQLLGRAGFTLLVATNQAGVGRGVMSAEQLAAVHTTLVDDAVRSGARIERVYSCVHAWDAGCACRKPAPGMLLQAQRDFDLDLSRTVFVGDDERDELAARAAGCRYRHVGPGHSLLDVARELTAAVPAR